MNYKQLYLKFVNKFKEQKFSDGQYTELHHIVPKHHGGDNSPSNLVRVTHRQHIFLHRLLWRIYGMIGDKVAYEMMSGQTAAVRASVIELARLAKLGKPLTDQHKLRCRNAHLERLTCPENLEKLKNTQLKSARIKADKAEARSNCVITNAERNEEWLNKVSTRSVYKFISPEGLEFDSPIYAANYYGNVKPIDIENWCKRSKYGWRTHPELAKK